MAEYQISGSQYQELMTRLGPGYANVGDGKGNQVIANGADQREAGRNAQTALERNGQGATATLKLVQGNEFNPNRSQYTITTNDPRVQYELSRMGIQPIQQKTAQDQGRRAQGL